MQHETFYTGLSTTSPDENIMSFHSLPIAGLAYVTLPPRTSTPGGPEADPLLDVRIELPTGLCT